MNPPPGSDLKVGTRAASPARRFLRRIVVRLLRLRVWLTETIPGDLWHSVYAWAVLVGLAGACSSVAFREALDFLQILLLNYRGPIDGAATMLPWWGRLFMPALGGVLAGSILLLGQRWWTAGKSADFMEAVVIGNGIIRMRATLVKKRVVAGHISSAARSGGGSHGAAPRRCSARCSGGRAASRRRGCGCWWPAAPRRASPAPTTRRSPAPSRGRDRSRLDRDGEHRGRSSSPPWWRPWRPAGSSARTRSITCRPLGSSPPGNCCPTSSSAWSPASARRDFSSCCAAARRSSSRLSAAGAGEARARRSDRRRDLHPAAGGLGQRLRRGRVDPQQPLDLGGRWCSSCFSRCWPRWPRRAAARSAAVFTPTLFVGAVIGALYAEGLRRLLPGAAIATSDFCVIGMGCFLSAMTRAPIMSILIMFEMTHADATIMPLMLACVASFFVARSLSSDSVYSRQLHQNQTLSETPLFLLHVRDLMKPDPLSVAGDGQLRADRGAAGREHVQASLRRRRRQAVPRRHRAAGPQALPVTRPTCRRWSSRWTSCTRTSRC
ncbi:MAG: chloride channel protein [Verrucomicrobiota bacterium]